MTVVPGKFDAAAAVAALKKAHYPATKAEDLSPAAATEETTEAPATSESVKVQDAAEPAEELPETEVIEAPKKETEVIE